MKPPASITVGPLTYTVKVDSQRTDDAECYGFCDHTRSAIVIDSKLTDEHTRVIVLHETLHAIVQDAIGALRGGRGALLPDCDTEERLVTAPAPWLLDTLRRNPEFTAYLLA